MKNIQSNIMETKSLRSFFKNTQQDNLDFLGEDHHIVFWSYEIGTGKWILTEGLQKLFGYSIEEMSQIDFFRTFFQSENGVAEENLNYYIQRFLPFDLEYKTVRKDGSTIWLKTKGSPIFDSSKGIIRYNGVTRDITAKVKKEAELAETADKYRTLLEQNAHAVYISQDGKYQYVTQQMTELTGYTVHELVGMNYDQLLDEESIELVLKRVEAFLSGKDLGSQEINIIRKDQSKRIAEVRSSVITYNGKPALMGTLLDITEKKKALDLANHLAYYDALTGLPNRNLLLKKFDPFLKTAKEKGMKVALLFINMDQYKTITDTFGHHAGGEVIKEAGYKMKELLPDSSFIAKCGDHDFAAFFPYDHIDDIKQVGSALVREVPLALNTEIKLIPNIGISLFPAHGEEAESLLRFADIAMYQSKRNQNRQENYSFYNPNMMTEITRTNKLANNLQKGMELKQFYLVYQPKVWLNSGKLEGVEALIRWEHPAYGNISPMEFIPLAEKSGHIIDIGDWVLETAIQDIQKTGLSIMLNVNISMRQLLDNSFIEKIKSLLEKTLFPAEQLNLEITESVVIFDIEETVKILNHLKNLGINISLDDFGTGYSSLSYLTRLPIDCLKIDRSFVMQLESEESKKTMIQNIIQTAHALKMEVIAEGIETKEQAELLKMFNCEKGQGYYFSKPLPFQELLQYVDAQQ